jgi:spermidine synthase
MLGMVSPFAIRVCSSKLEKVGNTAGSIYSLSTVGSIIGTFIPALMTIPFIGTRKTIILFAFILVLGSAIGLLKSNRKLIGLPLLILIPFFLTADIKPAEGLVFEDESIYHYIQVVQEKGMTKLKLNEGHAVHSVYDPKSIFVGGVWDYFSVVPLINHPKDVLIIGLAGGTISNAYAELYPNMTIDGVEIDSKIIDVGRKYFNLNEQNVDIYTMDGRIFLQTTEEKYGLIIVDAYRQPYIPFHLTTKEFFLEAKRHLKKGGINAINVGATSEDSDVLKMVRNTMKSVYKHVYQVRAKNSLNFVVIGTDADYNMHKINNTTSNDNLGILTNYVNKKIEEVDFDENILVLTDDKAPVEIFTDKMIYEYGSKE